MKNKSINCYKVKQNKDIKITYINKRQSNK